MEIENGLLCQLGFSKTCLYNTMDFFAAYAKIKQNKAEEFDSSIHDPLNNQTFYHVSFNQTKRNSSVTERLQFLWVSHLITCIMILQMTFAVLLYLF